MPLLLINRIQTNTHIRAHENAPFRAHTHTNTLALIQLKFDTIVYTVGLIAVKSIYFFLVLLMFT